MNVSYTKCDTCGWEENNDRGFGGYRHNWIEINVCVGGSDLKLPSGTSHYCNELCLITKLTKVKG